MSVGLLFGDYNLPVTGLRQDIASPNLAEHNYNMRRLKGETSSICPVCEH